MSGTRSWRGVTWVENFALQAFLCGLLDSSESSAWVAEGTHMHRSLIGWLHALNLPVAETKDLSLVKNESRKDKV